MSHRWAALVLVLALCAMTPRYAAGQIGTTPRGHKLKGTLGPNFPNPFNPETTIPFTVEGCADGNEQVEVSVRILNVVAAVVAIPVFAGPSAGSTANVSTSLNKQPMRNLRVPCGSYNTYWDGNNQRTGKEAASGVYIVQLFLNGERAWSRKIFNAK